jgi:hypothetical protein
MKIGPAKPFRFAVVSAVVISLAFLALVGFISPSEFWGSVSAFATTLVSVFAAFFIGLGLYDRQVRIADARRREELTDALLAELSETIKALGDPQSFQAQPYTPPSGTEVPITYLQAVILEDAARSGLFNTTATRQMLSLARQFRVYNLRITQLFSALSQRGPSYGFSDHYRRDMTNLFAAPGPGLLPQLPLGPFAVPLLPFDRDQRIYAGPVQEHFQKIAPVQLLILVADIAPDR